MPNTTTPNVETSSATSYVIRTSYVISGVLFYIMLCSAFRFGRRDAMLKKYRFTGRKSLARMTNVEAQAIMGQLAELEFPKIYYTSVQWVLFLISLLSSVQFYFASRSARVEDLTEISPCRFALFKVSN